MRGKATVFSLYCSWMALVLCSLSPVSTPAQKMKVGKDKLDGLTFVNSQYRTSASPIRLESTAGEISAKTLEACESFKRLEGGTWSIVVDRFTGNPSLVEGSGIPWIPGKGNSIPELPQAFAAGEKESQIRMMVESNAASFLERHPGLFSGANIEELVLNEQGSGPIGDYLYFLDYRWSRSGIPVEKAHVVFRLNHGNLVQFGQEYISPAIARLDTKPAISLSTAREILSGYIGGTMPSDRVVEPGRLLIVPETSRAALQGPFKAGAGIDYRLVYVISFRRDGVIGTWEGRVDAHTGEMVSFTDTNSYGKIHGGAYPTDLPATEVDRPFPFADTGSGYADQGGTFPGNSATSALNGRYIKINDNCGPVNGTTSNGDLNFGLGAGTDCDTPGSGGAGNTHATRTQYYHISAIQIKARSYNPGNAWVNGQLGVNVNINDNCNGYWDGETINFFRSGNGCGNTGELPGVSLHEWAHGFDTNDGNGTSPDKGTGETYGDFTGSLQTHSSCAGNGFQPGQNCHGYYNACTDCTGVRDIDYMKHQNQTPSTTQGFAYNNCPDPSPDKLYYIGPCGKEGHCESLVSSEAMWDLATRDLPASGLDSATAWQLVDRWWYFTRSTAGSAYNCTNFQSDGCGAATYHTVLRVADDCDGNLANGTPHAAAIHAAFDRHGISCASQNNTNQSGCCPSLAAPSITATPSGTTVNLSWPAVSGASSYGVFRNEAGCDAGYAPIATVASTSHSDNLVVEGMTYYYRVQAYGTTQACSGTMSNCATVRVTGGGGDCLCKGDVNCDKAVNVGDSIQVKRCILGLDSGATCTRSDVNGDGSVNVGDSIQVKRYILGLDACQ